MQPDIQIIQGDDVTMSVTFKDRDGNPTNITGSTIFFTIKKSFDSDPTDGRAIIKKTVTIHTNPTGGISEVALSNAETGAIEARKYYFDFQLKDANGKITSTRYGILEVVKDVTNRTS